MGNSDWIKTKDRMPEDRRAVLASCPRHDNVFALCYHKDEDKWYIWSTDINAEEYDIDTYGEVEAWMPMPKCFVDYDNPRSGDIGIFMDGVWCRVWKGDRTATFTLEEVFGTKHLHRCVNGDFCVGEEL